MNKAVKITLSIILDILLLIFMICGFGFTIGGEKDIEYYTFSLVCSILISLGTIAFINGISYIKNLEKKAPLIVVTIAILVIMIWAYNPMNCFTKSDNYIEYEAEIIKEHYPRKGPGEIYINNQKGEEVIIKFYNSMWLEDEKVPEAGKTIVIREYEGGFGFPYYDWVEIKE